MTLSPAAIRARAGSRCECPRCPVGHKGRCRRERSALSTSTRPIVLHIHDGRVMCHLCLNRTLEVRMVRLYPEIIPLAGEVRP